MKNKHLSSIKNKMLQKLLVMSMLCITYTLPSLSQSILEDTIWYRHQNYDVKNVQFLKYDQYIVVNGEHIFNTQNGEEILFLKSGATKGIVPFQNDDFFLRRETPSNKFYIYKTEGFQIIDSLESDPFPPYAVNGSVSLDNIFFVSVVNNRQNLAVWDIKSKKIITKFNEKDTTLKNNIGLGSLTFSADNSKIYLLVFKSYYLGKDAKDNDIYKETSNIVIFDSQTLDSIGVINDVLSFRISKDRKLMAINGYGNQVGIKILDLQTMKVKLLLDYKPNQLTDFKFSDDNKYLVTVGQTVLDGFNFWDLENGKKVFNYNSSVIGFDISKDNSKLISYGGKELLLLKTHLNVNGITNPVSDQTIIYPNPVNQKATIEFASRIRNVEYSIVNQSGNIVKKSLYMANPETVNKLEIDFTVYPTGIYFINLFTGEANPQTIKIVKE